MREDICTIPISKVFEPKEGCPICRMRDMLESRVTEYITGAAMMEPDIREVTNVKGFCHPHFSMMLKKGSRLSNALILESHLKEVEKSVLRLDRRGTPGKKEVEAAKKLTESCFVCDQIQWAMVRMFDTVYRLWMKEEDFRLLFSQQPYLCLPHYTALMEGAVKGVGKKNYDAFSQDSVLLVKNYLSQLEGDITHFCSMFDYRNNGGDFGASKDAIERSIQFLTSRLPGQ